MYATSKIKPTSILSSTNALESVLFLIGKSKLDGENLLNKIEALKPWELKNNFLKCSKIKAFFRRILKIVCFILCGRISTLTLGCVIIFCVVALNNSFGTLRRVSKISDKD